MKKIGVTLIVLSSTLALIGIVWLMYFLANVDQAAAQDRCMRIDTAYKARGAEYAYAEPSEFSWCAARGHLK
jgi:hypothetical protein